MLKKDKLQYKQAKIVGVQEAEDEVLKEDTRHKFQVNKNGNQKQRPLQILQMISKSASQNNNNINLLRNIHQFNKKMILN